MYGFEFVFMLTAVVFFSLIEYGMYTSKLEVSPRRKVLYTAVEFGHNFFVMFYVYMLIQFIKIVVSGRRFNLKTSRQLLLFDSLVIFVLITFILWEKCVLTILGNCTVDADPRTIYVPMLQRIPKLLKNTYADRTCDGNKETEQSLWLQGNIWTYIPLVAVNMYAGLSL